MNKYSVLIITLLVTALCLNVFAQPFDVKKTGQGKSSLILIPGFASSGEVWDETRAKFEKDFTCYTLTMPGFAGIKPQPNASFKNWENAIAAYIKENNITKPIIIGHSMGGSLALAIASDYPDLADKIIVVDALPCLAALMNPSFSSKTNNDCAATVNQMTSRSDKDFYQMQKMTMSMMLADTSKQEMVLGWSMRSDRRTLGEMFCDLSNTDLRQQVKNIKCPALILLEANFATVKDMVNAQYNSLKTANLQYANKGLHFIMYDDKEWYFKQLNNFLIAK